MHLTQGSWNLLLTVTVWCFISFQGTKRPPPPNGMVRSRAMGDGRWFWRWAMGNGSGDGRGLGDGLGDRSGDGKDSPMVHSSINYRVIVYRTLSYRPIPIAHRRLKRFTVWLPQWRWAMVVKSVRYEGGGGLFVPC